VSITGAKDSAAAALMIASACAVSYRLRTRSTSVCRSESVVMPSTKAGSHRQVRTELLGAGSRHASLLDCHAAPDPAGCWGEPWRARQRTHPAETEPQLPAAGPSQWWSWTSPGCWARWSLWNALGRRL